MKKKNIAMIMTMAMITSGVTAPMEAVYASDEIQIQSEDVFESENEDALGESADVTEATEDSFAESTESEATDMSEAEEVETTEDAEQPGTKKSKSVKKILIQRKTSQMCSLTGRKMLPRIVRKWLKAEVQMLEMPFIDCMQMELWLSTVQEHL